MARGRPPGADSTRRSIVEAALAGFADKGVDATSTREIAARAGANVAAIAYHFGGKEGLRLACAEHVVHVVGGTLDNIADAPLPTDPAAARTMLTTVARRFVAFLLLDPKAHSVAGFVLREMAQPSPALDLVYARLIEVVHRRATALFAIATGRPEDDPGLRLAVFSAIGQIVYFHFARPVVTRRMGWAVVGPAEAEAIADTVVRNLEARLDAERGAAR